MKLIASSILAMLFVLLGIQHTGSPTLSIHQQVLKPPYLQPRDYVAALAAAPAFVATSTNIIVATSSTPSASRYRPPPFPPVVATVIARQKVTSVSTPSVGAFVTQNQFAYALTKIENSLEQLLVASTRPDVSGVGAPLSVESFAPSQQIQNLQNVTITNPIITGLSASDIPALSSLDGMLGVSQGGTGTTTAPSYGQLLVGNSIGGYNLLATSSLGITGSGSSQWITSGSNIYYTVGSVGIGTSSPGSLLAVQGVSNFTTSTSTFYSSGGINLTSGCFSVNGTCITTVAGSSASSTLLGDNNTFSGKNVFTNATTTTLFSTTASSTNLFSQSASFGSLILGAATTTAGNGINLSSGCFAVGGTCISGSGGVSLSTSNTWTGLQKFTVGASSTNESVFGTIWVGGTATTTLQGSTTGTSTIQGFLNVVGTNSTSTFSGNLSVLNFSQTGSATSTFAQGLNISNGCFAIGGNCLGLNNLSGTLAVANGGTGSTTFGAGVLYSSGGTGALSATSSPSFGWVIATSSTATSTLAGALTVGQNYLVVGQNGNIGLGTNTPSTQVQIAQLISSTPALSVYN
ncbi:MAG TPA: hypothetical protein VMU13_03365, partial [Candidatus Paceibacterota bacterium]|nr:hypothetical protein [Candidatus Paceibacterota bacterium]